MKNFLDFYSFILILCLDFEIVQGHRTLTYLLQVVFLCDTDFVIKNDNNNKSQKLTSK